MPLTDKVAVIIGATGQLGPAIAKSFAHAGTKLVLVSSQQEGLDALQKELGFRDTRVMTRATDGMDPAAMQELADTVLARFGRTDILIHAASGFRGGTLQETDDEVWEYLLQTNLLTAARAIRAFLPMLTANNWGRILTISSGITQSPPPNAVAYVSAKAALETMTLAVANQVKDRGVTANVLLIRSLDTPAERAKQPDRLTGWVTAEDVAATLMFLCSDQGGAITGARIPVFGGS
jgi:NAD(P)-dependent dehydrogenase (short-subunit alcohol dehydrogenase family)